MNEDIIKEVHKREMKAHYTFLLLVPECHFCCLTVELQLNIEHYISITPWHLSIYPIIPFT